MAIAGSETSSLTLDDKLSLLMSLAAYDHDGVPTAPAALPPRLRHVDEVGALRPLNLRPVRFARAGATTLLRVLMTNACSFNCHYCPMRRDRNMPRTLLKPEELVRIFLGALERGWCTGLFITTGIPGRPVKVMDDLIQTLELLRLRRRFAGYIHVKIVPGADDAQIARITALASRVSINLEAACGDSLTRIAPEKRFDTSLATLESARLRIAGAQQEERNGRPRDRFLPGGVTGMTMQFVVGATPDTDRTIIERTTDLYALGGVHHAQFSAFMPIRDTPMEHLAPTPPLREQRLYQADHLIRSYGFTRDEIVYEGENLPLGQDPKVAWALAHPERFPVGIRTASYSALLRVPGIGPLVARRIVTERRTTTIRGLADLRKLGAITARAAGFLTIGSRRLSALRWSEQLGFWAPGEEPGRRQVVYEFSPGTFR